MSTWKILVKTTENVNVGGLGTVHLEKGMSVDYVLSNSFWGPLDSKDSSEEVNQLFIQKYNIDLKKFGLLTKTILDLKKI
jgi:hypothetical protein